MPNTISALLQQGLQHHKHGQLLEAEQAYAHVLAIDARQFDALHLIGVIAQQRGDDETAINFFGKAIRVDAKQANVHCNLGVALQNMGRSTDAIASYDIAISLNSQYALAWNNRGNALRSLGRFEDAVRSFEAAMEIDLRYAEAYLNRGITLQCMGRHDLALLDFGDAIHLQENNPKNHFARGVSLQQLLRLEETIEAYTQTLQRDARHTGALCNRAMVYARLGRYQDALNDLDLAIAIQEHTAKTHQQRAQVLRQMQRIDEAIAAYQTALSHGADAEIIQYALASLGEGHAPDYAPHDYIADLFDQYADHFDMHLLENLSYQIPNLIADALSRHLRVKAKDSLDLGCGTGLCGPYLHAVSQRLVGVDLSRAMLAKAQQKNVYASLVCQDLVSYLHSANHALEQNDVIVAADVLVYFGDLTEIFKQVATNLRAGGYFIFSVELAEQGKIQLRPSQRYAHSQAYINQLAQAFDLQIEEQHIHVGRQEDHAAINSLLTLLRKTQ